MKKDERKQVISIALPANLVRTLKKHRGYTLFIQSLIENSLGVCPNCGARVIDDIKKSG